MFVRHRPKGHGNCGFTPNELKGTCELLDPGGGRGEGMIG